MNAWLDPKESLSRLNGCGLKTVKKLNALGLFTCGDLLQFTGVVPGVRLDKLRVQIHKVETKDKGMVKIPYHTWKNAVVHILRKGKSVQRVRVGDLFVNDYRIFMECVWKENSKKKKKLVNPIMICVAQNMWISRDIISDDEQDEVPETLDEKLDELEENIHLCEITLLPKLALDFGKESFFQLSSVQKQNLESCLTEIDLLQSFCFQHELP